MNDLTDGVARHDDSTSAQHEKDKAAKKQRMKTAWEPVPAVSVPAGAGILDGFFRSPTKGFSFRMVGGSACKAKDSKQYTKDAIRLSQDRRKYRRVRLRDGKEVQDTGTYKHGAVSLVTTVAPWHVATLTRMSESRRDFLFLCLAEKAAARLQEISGRPMFGGGLHLDTAVPHFHFHVPKAAPANREGPGEAYAKTKFLTGGPWLVGADRIQRKFPGLLNSFKSERLENSLNRKDVAHLVDVQLARVIDEEMEILIEAEGHWTAYQKELQDYEKAKTKDQAEVEPLRRLVQAALSHHHRSGIWPIAYQVMSHAMWRVIPRDIRRPITLSIRATQIIRKPGQTLTMVGQELKRAMSEKKPNVMDECASGISMKGTAHA